MDRERITVYHMTYQITTSNTIWFLLWVFVKDQVYTTPVRDLADLESKIYAAVNNVTAQMLHKTWAKVEYRLDISHATNGSHVEIYGN